MLRNDKLYFDTTYFSLTKDSTEFPYVKDGPCPFQVLHDSITQNLPFYCFTLLMRSYENVDV
jgi:hypothetical protein